METNSASAAGVIHDETMSDPQTLLQTPQSKEPLKAAPRAMSPPEFRLLNPTDSTRSIDSTIKPHSNLIPTTPVTKADSQSFSTPFSQELTGGLWRHPSSPWPISPGSSTGIANSESNFHGRSSLSGSAFVHQTPQLPSNVADGHRHRRSTPPSSPLASRTRSSEIQILLKSDEEQKLASSPILITEDLDPTLNSSADIELPSTESPVKITLPLSDDTVIQNSEDVPLAQTPLAKTPAAPIVVPQAISQWLAAPSFHAPPYLPAAPERKRKTDITRRRLDMFRKGSAKSILEPVSHEYGGRILQPAKDEAVVNISYIIEEPQWPDDHYPWSESQKIVEERAEEKRRKDLLLIERYLDESSDEEDEEANPSRHVPWEEKKLVDPYSEKKPTIFLPSDPADALTALLAKRSARQVAMRHGALSRPRQSRMRKSDEEDDDDDDEPSLTGSKRTPEEDIACLCKGGDDGRRMVQCDNCHSWHHLECVNSSSIELPDKWYCWKCHMGGARSLPAFASGRPDSPSSLQFGTNATISLYQGNGGGQPSPVRDASGEATITQPLKESELPRSYYRERTPPSRRPIPSALYDHWPGDTEGPTLYSGTDRIGDITPGFGPSLHDPASTSVTPFDDGSLDTITSTPSRGLGLRFAPPYTTPKKERAWLTYPGPNTSPTRSMPAVPSTQFPLVQTDPLFIHYEHDAPKQTAHHQQTSSKPKRRSKTKEKESGEDRRGSVSNTEGPRKSPANRKRALYSKTTETPDAGEDTAETEDPIHTDSS